MSLESYYEALEISPSTSLKEVKRQVRRLLLRFHPDVNPDKIFAEKKTREILRAYEALSGAECGSKDPKKGDRKKKASASGDISSLDFVIFTLNRQRFALPVEEVREVLRLKDMRVVSPQGGSYLQGGIYWREQLIPLWDLRRRLRLGEESRGQMPDARCQMSEGEDTLKQVLVVSLDGQRVGLLVESVLEVVNLKESRVELSSKETCFGSTYLKGIAKFKEGDLGLLNLEEILRDMRGQTPPKFQA